MFNFFKKNKLPSRVQKAIAPKKDFVQKTKGRFLAAFDAHYGALRPAHHFTFAMKVLVVVLVLMGTTAGASVYADTNNVPADNPLYPLKRLSETVRLTIASPENKAALEATFAARRVVEINALEQSHPSSTLIPGLADDLDKEVNASIEANTSINETQKNNLCVQVLSILSGSSSAIHAELATHPRIMNRFQNQCGSAVGTPASSTFTTTTITPSITITSTSNVSVPPFYVHVRARLPLKINL